MLPRSLSKHATCVQSVQDMAGKQYPLAQYAGKVAVVVNVASQCGWTKRQVVYLLCGMACDEAKLVTTAEALHNITLLLQQL